jgi:hypothetical protein
MIARSTRHSAGLSRSLRRARKADTNQTTARCCPTRQPSSRIGENPPCGMIGRVEETSAPFEARSASRSCPTAGARDETRALPCPVGVGYLAQDPCGPQSTPAPLSSEVTKGCTCRSCHQCRRMLWSRTSTRSIRKPSAIGFMSRRRSCAARRRSLRVSGNSWPPMFRESIAAPTAPARILRPRSFSESNPFDSKH